MRTASERDGLGLPAVIQRYQAAHDDHDTDGPFLIQRETQNRFITSNDCAENPAVCFVFIGSDLIFRSSFDKTFSQHGSECEREHQRSQQCNRHRQSE